MKIRISHQTRYVYDAPVKSIVQTLRLTPRSHVGQHVSGWRVELDADAAIRAGEDALGNCTYAVSIDGPLQNLTIAVSGEVETIDLNGMVKGAIERFSPDVFLRETPLTTPDQAMIDFAENAVAGASGPLDSMHRLLMAIHENVAFDTAPTQVTTRAAEAFALKKGVCQDLTHIFIACARHLGIPARYVSGYFVRADGVVVQDAGHAWAEAMIDELGWIGFDPANGICPTDAHVRVAIGLDYLGAAPIRGSRFGGGGEKLDVALTVARSMQQAQS
jgi:transglutaminase-like putative cysteine protease